MSDTESPKKNSFVNWFQNNLSKILIAIISLLYIAQGAFDFIRTNADIKDILGTAALSICIGVIISHMQRNAGLLKGRLSELFKGSMKAYGEVKVTVTPYLDKLTPWCTYKNKQELEERRKEIIQRGGLNWKAFKFGFYKDHLDKLNKAQLKTYYLAVNAKVPRLTSNELLSDLPYERSNTSKFGMSEAHFKRKGVIMDLFSKIFISVICASYVLAPIINAESLSNILWHTMQITLWITLGVSKYLEAKSFMENEYRQTHLVQKTEYLNEFRITMQNNPHVIDEVEDETGLTQDIEDFLKNLEKGVTNGKQNESIEHGNRNSEGTISQS